MELHMEPAEIGPDEMAFPLGDPKTFELIDAFLDDPSTGVTGLTRPKREQ